MTKKITWVLAHEPYQVFHKAAAHFAKEVFEETNGEYEITFLDLPDYNKQFGKNLVPTGEDRNEIIRLVDQGEIDMATVYVNNLAQINRDLYVWGMPFMLQDIDHAIQALDGAVGQSMLDVVSQKTNVKPLVYTFSGGFRAMPSTHAIERIEDFTNAKLRCHQNPVVVDMFSTLDAVPVQMDTEDFADAMLRGDVLGGEATYPRFFLLGYDRAAKYINHTEHNLFLTSIVTNNQLWRSMDAKTQSVFAAAAKNAADLERVESLAHVDSVQAKAKTLGIETVTMTAKEKQRFIDATRPLYDKYATWFGPGLLQGLSQVH
jgi:TRAP-type C4-dicarboxylate transport system substrate-binding protein